jgi:TonB family protein
MSFLIDTTLRMSLLVLGALGVAALLARGSAALRHWVLAIGIACGAATPLLQLALPTWVVHPVALPGIAPVPPQPASAVTAIVVQTGTAGPQDHRPPGPAPVHGRRSPLTLAVASLWLGGTLMSLAVLLVRLLRLSRAAASATSVEAPHLVAIAGDIRRAMGLRRPVTLLHASGPALLATWGALRPKVMLPGDASGWPEARVRVVLRHEFAHIARGDWLAQMVAETLRAMYWFNPLLWIACRRLRDEGERACDDAVLRAGVEPADYATHLLELARAARRPTSPALAMARSSSLEGRVTAMLNTRANHRPLARATRVATLVAFAAISVPIATAQTGFASFSGTIVDQTSRLVPGAVVVMTDGVTQAKYEVRSDRVGKFEFVALPPGEYQLAVQRPGFKTVTDAITVAATPVTRRIELEIGSLHETVSVTGNPGEPAPVDPERQARLEELRRRARAQRNLPPATCGDATGGDIGGQIVPPLKLTHVRPEYPETLRAAGIAGTVTLDALIGTDGVVRDVKVVSSPHPELERLATDAVRQWEFSTTFLNCTPVEVPMRVTVRFATP